MSIPTAPALTFDQALELADILAALNARLIDATPTEFECAIEMSEAHRREGRVQ